MRCVSFCTAKNYDLMGLNKVLKTNNFNVKLHKNFIHVKVDNSQKNVFIFINGCIVTWGLKRHEEEYYITLVKNYSIEMLSHIEIDYFSIKSGNEIKFFSDENLNVDILELNSDDPQLKLAISFGLAQSIKLESYEEKIQMSYYKNIGLVEQLSKNGNISLPRKAIICRMGEIFLDRASINLKSEHTDVPEFFWENPGLEAYYIMCEQFLDIPRRVRSVNHKLDVLHDIFQMLKSQLEHSYSTFLEYIVIALIAVEVLFSFLHFFTK